MDVYERVTGTTTRLVSTDGNFNAGFVAGSSDGSKAFFKSGDGRLFERAGRTTTEIPAQRLQVRRDHHRRWASLLHDAASLVPSDQDTNECLDANGGPVTCDDLYEYSDGTIKLVSAKPDGTGVGGGHAVFEALSGDEQHVYFTTGDQLTPDDTTPGCSRYYVDEEGNFIEFYGHVHRRIRPQRRDDHADLQHARTVLR